MKNLQEKLDFLLDKYSVDTSAKIIDKNYAEINGEKVALLPWRNERRFIELKNLTKDGTINGISVMRVLRMVSKGENLEENILREIDLCLWILESDAKEIMTFKNGDAANIVIKLANDVVCTLEISANLGKDTAPVDKHEIIARQGIACDRVVDTQVPQNSIYVFGKEKNAATYTDVDFELFGLEPDEIFIVRHVFEIAKNTSLVKTLNDDKANLDKLCALALQSADELKNIKVEG